MLRFVILIIFIGFSSSYAGESGYQFLRVGVPARATGLGDTYVSQFGDVNTFMYNPAGLSKLSHRQFSAGYMNHILDIGSGFLNGAAGLSAGLGFKHQNYVFDYSFSSWGIGAVNRFSLTVNL